MKAKMKLSPKLTQKLELKTILIYTGAGIAISAVLGVLAFFYFNIGSPESALAATVRNTRASGFWNQTSVWNGGVVPNPSTFGVGDRVNINTGHEVVVPEGLKLNFNHNKNELHVYGIFIVKDDFAMAQNNILTIYPGGILIFMNKFVSLQNINFTNSGKVVFLGDVNLMNDPTLANSGTIYTDSSIKTSGTGAKLPESAIQDDSQLMAILQFHGYAPSTLPVTLLGFTAEVSDQVVNVKWSTANEKDNDYFVIERSRDGKNFESLGRVNGAGNSMNVLKYTYTDHSPLSGRSFYRLRQVDYNGEFEIFDPVMVNRSSIAEEFQIVSASPNPFSDRFVLKFTVEKDGDVELQLLNSKGEKVISDKFFATTGTNQYEYHENKALPNEIYFLRIIQNGKSTKPIRMIKK